MNKYRGLYTFDTDNHRYVPLVSANGIVDLSDTDVYEPTEPLIKDEKIRKAVRAWAEANSLKEIQYRSEDLGDRFNGFDSECIQFNPWQADNLKDHKDYTIEELCGEEKE